MDSLISKANTALPRSLRPVDPVPETARKYNHIANRKLRTILERQSANSQRGKALLRDAELLLPNKAGKMEMEGDTDRSWRISQDEIVDSISVEAARGRKEFTLDGGPYRARYTYVRPDLSPFPNMGLLSPVSCWIIHNTQSPKRNMYSSMIVTASSFIG